MARYVGGSLAVAAASTVFTAVATSHQAEGATASVALAAGLSRASLMLAIFTPRAWTAGLSAGQARPTGFAPRRGQPRRGSRGGGAHHPPGIGPGSTFRVG